MTDAAAERFVQALCTHPRFVDREYDGVFWLACAECGMDSHDVEHQRESRRVLTVMQAHLAADCPDRDTCWARDIHDAHSPREAEA